MKLDDVAVSYRINRKIEEQWEYDKEHGLIETCTFEEMHAEIDAALAEIEERENAEKNK